MWPDCSVLDNNIAGASVAHEYATTWSCEAMKNKSTCHGLSKISFWSQNDIPTDEQIADMQSEHSPVPAYANCDVVVGLCRQETAGNGFCDASCCSNAPVEDFWAVGASDFFFDGYSRTDIVKCMQNAQGDDCMMRNCLLTGTLTEQPHTC